MKRKVPSIVAALLVVPTMLLIFTSVSIATPQEAVKEEKTTAFSDYTITVLNPQGVVKKERDLVPRLDTLKGKKVAMWLSATADQIYAGKGAELYILLEKMLRETYPDIQIVSFTDLPMKFAPENEVVDAIVATKPDAVVAGFGG